MILCCHVFTADDKFAPDGVLPNATSDDVDLDLQEVFMYLLMLCLPLSIRSK